jgi:hypothetical protein
VKLSLLFKISGVILVVNGLSMLATPGMAIEMYGMEQTADLVVAMGALGLSFLGTGILTFMLPSWIDDKLAAAGILMGLIQLSWVARVGYDLYAGSISGPPAIINVCVAAILAALFLIMSLRASTQQSSAD